MPIIQKVTLRVRVTTKEQKEKSLAQLKRAGFTEEQIKHILINECD